MFFQVNDEWHLLDQLSCQIVYWITASKNRNMANSGAICNSNNLSNVPKSVFSVPVGSWWILSRQWPGDPGAKLDILTNYEVELFLRNQNWNVCRPYDMPFSQVTLYIVQYLS